MKSKTFFYSELFLLTSLLITLCVERIYPQIILKGEQWGTYAAGQYLVTDDIIVPEGKTMVVAPGTVIYFNRYSGIVVRGTLACKGTLESGIHFTAAASNADSVDAWGDALTIRWNGVEVKPQGSVEFENVRIINSIFGIKAAQEIKCIILKDIMFLNNEQDFSLGDSTIQVDNQTPFTYMTAVLKQEQETTAPTIPETGKQDKIKSKREKEKTREPWQLPVRICLGSVAVAGGVLGIICHYQAEDYKKDYPSATEDATEIREKANTLYKLRNACIVAGAAGALGFTITFLF